MLVCYLDDSGTDPQNPIYSVGGYAASRSVWATFEETAAPIFQEYIGNRAMHAKDLHRGGDIFKGWSVLKKQAFVAKLCLTLYPLKPLMGVSFSVNKSKYQKRATEALERDLRKRTNTPHAFCTVAILNWILTDREVGKMANVDGVELILESGNKNNEEARLSLDAIKKIHGLDFVRSMAFVAKDECRAIQMADLFAYYTRRHNRNIDVLGREPEVDPVLQVLVENVRQRSFVATDFGPDIPASRFLAGDP